MNFLEVKSLKYLSFIFLFLFTSCHQQPAKIINKNNLKFTKGNKYNQEKYLELEKNKESSNKNIQNQSSPLSNVNDSTDKIIVDTGDTLYSISKKNNVTLRELIDYNNFQPPYQIKIGDIVKIPNSNYHESRDGETLYSISRMYGMKVNDLIALNNLKFPYSIYPGDKIKIAGTINNKTIDDSLTVKSNPASNSKTNLTKNIEKKSEDTALTKAPIAKSSNLNNDVPTYKFSRPQETKIETSENNLAKTPNKPLDKNSANKIPNKNNKFYWPTRGKIISKFGPKSAGLYNDGINIEGKEGQTVVSSEDGIVAYVGNELKGYGNLIIVKHSEGWISAYAHLRNYDVKKGQKVNRGQKIGSVGNSGKVKSSQLYFSLRKGREAVNPEKYLNY